MGERERGSKGWIICEGIDASSVGFEVVTPLKSQIGVARWDVFLFCRPLISDGVIGKFDDMEDDAESGEEIWEFGEVFLHGVDRFVGYFIFVGYEPVFEDLLSFIVEGEEGDVVVFGDNGAKVLEVFCVGDFFEDSKETVLRLSIFRLVGIGVVFDCVWVDEELKALNSAIMGEVDFRISEVLDEFDGLDAAVKREAQHWDAEFASHDTHAAIAAQTGMSFEVERAIHFMAFHFPLNEHSDKFITLKKDAFWVFLEDLLQGFNGRVIDTIAAKDRKLWFVL